MKLVILSILVPYIETLLPSGLKIMKVGILAISNSAKMSSNWSASKYLKVSLSENWAANSSKLPSMLWQGPHHSAENWKKQGLPSAHFDESLNSWSD